LKNLPFGWDAPKLSCSAVHLSQGRSSKKEQEAMKWNDLCSTADENKSCEKPPNVDPHFETHTHKLNHFY
jgi:hypothetical protein